MSNTTHLSAIKTCQNYNPYEPLSSYPNQGYTIMPYEYEEIPVLKQKQQNVYYKTNTFTDNTADTSATLFEDLNENSSELNTVEQQHRLPPPITKPPPIPSKV